jgi:2',3'-cyclic-nucleotide 2'-phosphodiesterase (5'-nucleotidase family)
MKKLFLSLLFVSLPGLLNAGEIRSLMILHTNDFHGHISQEENYAGAAKISSLFKQTRAARDDVLILDAGDAVSGTPVSTLFKGVPIFEVMSSMGYDVGLLGNHEFDYGWKQINEFMTTANFPLLNGNAFDPEGNLLGDGSHRIIEINGIRIGIFGLITEQTPYIIIPEGNQGLRFDPPEKHLQKMVDQLKSDTDLVILLAHIGHEEELKIAQQTDGIDIIVGGHSHTHVNPPVKVKNRSGSTWVAQAHKYGSHVGQIEINVDIDEDRITQFRGNLIPARELPLPDVAVKALIDQWEQQVTRQVDVQIAIADKGMQGHELKRWMEMVLKKNAASDLAYYNRGGVRDQIHAGVVTARHIWNIEPFGNTLVTMTLKGMHINKILEKDDDHRAKLEPNQLYSVATNNFIGQHVKKRLQDAVQIRDKGVLIRDVLIDYIQANGLP